MSLHQGDSADVGPVMRVHPGLAAAIGLNESIVLLQIDYLISISTAEERDGKRWTYQSWKGEFEKMFPWMSEKTLRRAIDALEEMGLIEIGHWSTGSRHRTHWYTVNQDRLAELSRQNVLIVNEGTGQNDRIDGELSRQNVRKYAVKMSASMRSKCLQPLNKESYLTKTSTETSTKRESGADAPSPPAKEVPAAKAVKAAAKETAIQVQHRHQRDLTATYFETFASPTFSGAGGRIARDFGVLLRGGYTAELIGRFIRAVGRQSPNARKDGLYLDSRDLGPLLSAYRDAGCPDELGAVIALQPTGGTYAGRTNGIHQDRTATGENKYRADRLLEDAIAERARSQRRSVPA